MMMRIVSRGVLLLVFGLLVTGTNAKSPHAGVLENHQFKVLRGMRVENHDGEHLGALKDFVLNADSGRAEFIVIKSGRVSAFSKQRIAPTAFLSLDTVKRRTVSLDVADIRWQSAPVFKRYEIADLSDPAKKQKLAAFYRVGGHLGETNRESSPLAPTGQGNTPSRHEKEKLILATDLIGQTVIDAQGRSIGRISDLLMDPAGRGETLIIFSGRGFLKRATTFAAPLRFTTPAGQNQLHVPLNQTDLEAAPTFDWTTPDRAQVYRYKS
jgi:sporulation protein YlmC with PRC-barrel domain